MTRYLSTFISGLSVFIKDEVKKDLKDVDISFLGDGFIVYKTSSSPDDIKSLNFLNNSFLLIEFIPKYANLNDLTQRFIKNKQLTDNLNIPSPFKTFRVRFFEKNEPASFPKKQEEILEAFITKRFSLKVDRTDPDTEFWFSVREEGQGYIGLLLTKRDRDTQRGELKNELSTILCLLSDPHEDDIFLDPFAGTGSITSTRQKIKPYKRVIASDIKGLGPLENIEVNEWDALKTPLEDSSVTKIVTDPPWGDYETGLDIKPLYNGMLSEFSRILSIKGTVVLLTGQKELFEAILVEFPEFRLVSKLDILVSGKKAAIYKIVKEDSILKTEAM